MNLPPSLEKLHKIKFNMPIGAVLALVVNIVLITLMWNLDVNAVGYYILLLTVIGITFFIFYVFGIRELKWMIAFGLVIFLILGAVSTYFNVEMIYSQDDPLASEDGFLTNGTITPFIGSPADTYRFDLTYTGNQTVNDTEIKVLLFKRLYSSESHTLDMIAVDPSDTNTADGKDYYALTAGNVTMDEEVYSFIFEMKKGTYWDYLDAQNHTNDPENAEKDDILTNENWGPLTKEKGTVFTALLPTGMIIQGFCNLGMLFFIVALLYWWMGKAKAQRREWEMAQDDALKPKEPEPFKSKKKTPVPAPKKKPKKAADFSCTSCGGDAYDDDEKCQHCGEPFEDEIEEPEEIAEDKQKREADFSCTSCGGDVWDDDEKCQHCGESFDDDEDEGEESGKDESDDAETEEDDSDDPDTGKDDDGIYKFCPHCGKDLEKQFYFCPHCGKPLEEHDD